MAITALPQQSSISITSTIALEPVRQTLLSMALLTANMQPLGNEPWLAETAGRLSPTVAHTNRLLFRGLADALTEQCSAPNFPAYLDALAAAEPATLAARVKANPDTPMEQRFQQEIAQLCADPVTLQQRIINHLRTLWHDHFAAEWEKKQSMMSYIAGELNGRSWPNSSPNALIRAFIRRPVPEWLAGQLGGVERIILVPSPYLHFQAARFDEQVTGTPTTLWILLWADFWVWPMRTEPIQRTEVLRTISALDDETRLQIVEMLAATAELRAQEIIARLGVGQSTVSRQLKQLVNAGFLSEERAGDANKVYRLQRERIGEVTYALTQLLSAENAQLVLTDVRLTQPAELRPFLDREGLVTTWPAKRKGQETVLAYLITKFATGENYTESAVNELLKEWHTYDDPAYLRRCLIDEGLLKRTPDGAQYWREG